MKITGISIAVHGLGAATLLLACSTAGAQSGVIGYLQDTRGGYVKTATGLCIRTGYWTPAMAIAECDPDLVPKPAAKPGPVAAPQPAPAPAPRAEPPRAAPAPAPALVPAPATKPTAKPATAARCDGTVTLAADELFGFNSATLTAAARGRIDRDVIPRIASCARIEAIVVEGHTDRLGSVQYNQKLSERRAVAVKNYLTSKGIAGDRVQTVGKGKADPAKFCPDDGNRKALIACLAPNRRVTISVRGPAR